MTSSSGDTEDGAAVAAKLYLKLSTGFQVRGLVNSISRCIAICPALHGIGAVTEPAHIEHDGTFLGVIHHADIPYIAMTARQGDKGIGRTLQKTGVIPF